MTKKTKEEEMLDAAIADVNKRFGEGTILDDKTLGKNVEWIETGCYSIDKLLGGGIPRGRIMEVYGSPSSGKTTMALFIAGQIQKRGLKVAFLDVEQAFNGEWAEQIGVDLEYPKFTVSQPTTVEQTFDIMNALMATKQIDLIIVDSVDAMIPAKELEDIEKETMGLKARTLGKHMRPLVANASKSKTSVIFINQTRADIGGFFAQDITPGGAALKFYTSIRVSVTKGEKFMDGTQQIGNALKLTTKKNKLYNPFRTTELHIYYDMGIDLMQDTLMAALDNEIISKSGNTYSYEDTKLGVGKDKAKLFLRENPEVYDAISAKLKEDKKDKKEPSPETDSGDGEEG